MAKSPFSSLSDELQRIIADQPARRMPGHWTTGELAALLKVSRQAVLLQVHRGQIEPINRTTGQEHFFTDVEVCRYLSRPKSVGRRTALEADLGDHDNT